MDAFFYLAALTFLTFWSGFFSASEIALFSLPSSKVRSFESSPAPRKKLIATLLAKPRDLLVTIFMLNTLVNILLQNVSSSMFGPSSGWALRVGFPLILTLILGEIIPKYIAMQFNVTLSQKIAPLIAWFTKWIGPLRDWTVKITAPISQVMFFFLKKEKAISKEELSHVLQSSLTGGVLNKDEAGLIYGYINLQESDAADLMRPREEILYYDIQDPLTKLVHIFVDEEVTRVPVCQEGLDHVIGMITSHDYFLYKPMLKEPRDLHPILTKPFFLPESTPASTLLRRFEEKEQQIALVVDEHKAISGIIAVEDLVEEVIGDITDRRDQDLLTQEIDKKTIITSGKLELSELEDLLGLFLESPHHMKTVGGYLTDITGAIPKAGEKIETNQATFLILSADEKRVKRVQIRKK